MPPGKDKPSAKNATTALQNDRGRARVEARLIKATGLLLAKMGPRAMTIRDIAKQAGVNHGQIHHYFGGKRGLIEVTMRHLARQYAETTNPNEILEFGRPKPLSLSKDQTYVMAVLRLVLDDEIELATIDLDEGVSVARRGVEDITRALGYEKPTTGIKAVVAAVMMIEMSWAVMAPFTLRQIGAKPSEEKKIHKRLGEISQQMMIQALSDLER
jgi:AcrR family transcriptional regulator